MAEFLIKAYPKQLTALPQPSWRAACLWESENGPASPK
jgi:hypothetical protein